MTKPKPLNLEEVKKKTFEHFCEMLFGTKKPKDVIEWADIGKIGGEYGIDGEEIEELIEFTIKEIKQRIKSACEFWLMFQDLDGMKELIVSVETNEVKLNGEEKKQLYEFHLEYSIILEKERYNDLSDLEDRYNEWLFKKAFKDVLGGEK